MAGLGLNRRSWTDLSATRGFAMDREHRRKLPASEPFDHGLDPVLVGRKSDAALQVGSMELTVPNRCEVPQTYQLGFGAARQSV